jgi:signal transduction histidine kinase
MSPIMTSPAQSPLDASALGPLLDSLATPVLLIGPRTVIRSCNQAAAAEEPPALDLDAPRIERVLQNLLDNAIKYSPAGGAVRVEVLREGGTRFTVYLPQN